jgi:hypothetical protein
MPFTIRALRADDRRTQLDRNVSPMSDAPVRKFSTQCAALRERIAATPPSEIFAAM